MKYMSENTCNIAGCDKTPYCRDLCRPHYRRLREYGDPLAPTPTRKKPTSTTKCSVEGCDGFTGNGHTGSARGYCHKHYARWRTWGNPEERDRRFALPGTMKYRSAHLLVNRVRGSASQFDCIECGKQAQEWAYDHRASDELADEEGRPYSCNPEHYDPMCKSCHRSIDKMRRINARRQD